MFGKNPVPDLRAEKTEKWGMFDGSYFKNGKRYQKTLSQSFRISIPSSFKIESENRNGKSPNFGFSIFSSSRDRIFFILHIQLEDHESLELWPFSGKQAQIGPKNVRISLSRENASLHFLGYRNIVRGQ